MPQGLTRQSVLHFVHMINYLGARVTDANLVVNDRGVHIQVHVLIQRNSQDKSAMLVIEGRKVCTASPESQPKRRTSNDHIFFLFDDTVDPPYVRSAFGFPGNER